MSTPEAKNKRKCGALKHKKLTHSVAVDIVVALLAMAAATTKNTLVCVCVCACFLSFFIIRLDTFTNVFFFA